jgi:hypothetical protein
MIFRRVFTQILLILISLSGNAQTDTLISTLKTSSDLRISYNSSLIYPGIRFGIEFPVNSLYHTKRSDTDKQYLIIKERFISASTGWYHHKNFHDNIYFTIEWLVRRTHEKRFYTEFSTGAGYSRTFLGATTYRVNSKGDVNILNTAGYNYIMLIASGGFGFDFPESRRKQLSIFYKFDILSMFPYNSTIYFRPAMELGLIYKPVNFIPVLTKTRRVKK